jgi:hypothetical protein
MSNQVLIVAADRAARTPAEVARSLQCTPVIVRSEEEAADLLGRQRFTLVAVAGNGAWQRIREIAEAKQPMVRVLELPEPNGEDNTIRRLMVRYLDRSDEPRPRFSEERYRFLSSVLEAFNGTLELREVVRRIVTITREEFRADRAWLLHPVTERAEFAKIIFGVGSPGHESDVMDGGPIPLGRSQALVRRALESGVPIVVHEGDSDLDPELAARFEIRSEMVQILRPGDEEPWAFGIHQTSARRAWTAEEQALFAEVGRHATLALNTSLMHARAAREMAKVDAILDQIPESAAVYDVHGGLERMNAAARRDPVAFSGPDAEGRLRSRCARFTANRSRPTTSCSIRERAKSTSSTSRHRRSATTRAASSARSSFRATSPTSARTKSARPGAAGAPKDWPASDSRPVCRHHSKISMFRPSASPRPSAGRR